MTPAVVQPRSFDANMTREERSNLVLAFARVLYVNGESTQLTVKSSERLSQFLELHAAIFLHWGQLEVQLEDADGKFISVVEAAPLGVDMNRVASTSRAVEELCDGRLAPAYAKRTVPQWNRRSTTCADVVVHSGGGRRSCGLSGALRCPTPDSIGPYFWERGGRCRSAPDPGPPQ